MNFEFFLELEKSVNGSRKWSAIISRKEKATEEKLNKQRFLIHVRPGIIASVVARGCSKSYMEICLHFLLRAQMDQALSLPQLSEWKVYHEATPKPCSSTVTLIQLFTSLEGYRTNVQATWKLKRTILNLDIRLESNSGRVRVRLHFRCIENYVKAVFICLKYNYSKTIKKWNKEHKPSCKW